MLYVLDGWHFPLMATLQDNNQFSDPMRPVIIVNLSQGSGPDVMALRARPISYRSFPRAYLRRHPLSSASSDMRSNSFVDRTYRTVPSDRGLLGHSYGGLFAVYVLGSVRRSFSGSSPPVRTWFQDNRLLLTEAQSDCALPSPSGSISRRETT